jgi:hypothetical protein
MMKAFQLWKYKEAQLLIEQLIWTCLSKYFETTKNIKIRNEKALKLDTI